MIFKTGEVVTLKLSSGEELITKIISEDHGYLTVEEPVSVAPGPQGIGLVPSMFTTNLKELVKVNISCIVMVGVTEDNVKLKYLEATTGIKVPSKKIVLG